jgi:2-amino-4-hydroxy-6-hydroxymethyldihydropteridine diphosphokinase
MLSVLRTPRKTRWLVASIWIAVLGGPFANVAHFALRGARGDYPPESDTIGIPIFLHALFYFPFELILLKGLKGYQSGVSLFIRNRRRVWAALGSWLIILFPVSLWSLAMILDGIYSGVYATSVFFAYRFYAFLLLRSGFTFSKQQHDTPTPMTAFGIALGSNLGDREANLRRGTELLLQRIPGARLAAQAGLHETAPVDCAPGTAPFINSVIEIEADLSPNQMHDHLRAVEEAMGRPAVREKNAPRTLDLDLLYAGSFTSGDPALTIPHPRLHLRRFVLEPLAEIRPDLVLPGMSKPITLLLADVP